MLSSNLLNKLSFNYESDNKNKFISNVLFSNPLSKLNNISQKNLNYNPVYNISVKPHLQVTNQKSSGRCWLFAALNVVRREMCDFYNLNNFEFSQSYLFFYDKLERMNYNMECIIKTKKEDVDSQLVQHLLDDPSCDGGQCDMITN